MAIPQWESFEHLEQQHPGASTDIDIFNALISDIYAAGRMGSKTEFREKWRDFMIQQFLYAKGDDRRANQNDPTIQFVTRVITRANQAYEDGKL